jgi:predicted hotdog family 3-hydroxylacyl-ACP dehydratase
MLFLDRLLATNEERTVCRVRIHDRPFFRDDDGYLPGWAGLEPMAQCVAAHGGVHSPAGAGSRPPIGFLLGCRRLEVRAERLSPDVAYAAAAVRLWGGATGLVSFDCELFEIETGERLLAGRINAYLPEDPSAVVEGRR